MYPSVLLQRTPIPALWICFWGVVDGLCPLGGNDISIGDDDKLPGDFARICFLAVIDGLWHLGGDDVSIGDDDMPLGDLLVSFEV